jgi:uncharacterized protein (DUF697 family)
MIFSVAHATRKIMTTEATSTATEPTLTPSESQKLLVKKITKSNMLWALGAGIIPLPWVDLLAITGVHVKLLKELGDAYKVPFKENLVKSSVGSLLGSLGAVAIGAGVGARAKSIPGIGTLIGYVTVPLFAAASTYALSRVFSTHFESGGTFLSFDASKVQAEFKKHFEQGLVEGKNFATAQ